MARRRSILIDARVNGVPGGHGLARSVLGLAGQLSEPGDGLALRVLVNARREQLFSLDCLPDHADVISTDITPGAAHRCRELAVLLRALRAAALYVPYMSFTPLLRPCPFVVTLHDTTLEKDAGYAGGLLRQHASIAGTRLVLRHAAAVTAPSSASLAEIRARYPQAPHPTLVPNGIHPAVFADVRAAAVARARERYRLPAEFVLAVGAHRPHKNHQVLVRALSHLPERVHLVLVGYFDRNFRDPLPALIARLGLGHRVRLVPEVDDELLPAVYRAASAFAFPSLSEGYGLPALEALAAGVPSAVSDIPVLAEVTAGAALLVPPRDARAWAGALTALLHDSALRARVAAAGHAVAHAATWQRGAAALGSLLSDVAGGRLPRSQHDIPPLRVASRVPVTHIRLPPRPAQPAVTSDFRADVTRTAAEPGDAQGDAPGDALGAGLGSLSGEWVTRTRSGPRWSSFRWCERARGSRGAGGRPAGAAAGSPAIPGAPQGTGGPPPRRVIRRGG